ncbi:hypothetical protein ACOBR2_02235 [Telmatobacter bradus]|uniref:hypothetical protein n=1 Tax=Telmatobacter bradus TaxID=474953 RepID=UPI003B43C263
MRVIDGTSKVQELSMSHDLGRGAMACKMLFTGWIVVALARVAHISCMSILAVLGWQYRAGNAGGMKRRELRQEKNCRTVDCRERKERETSEKVLLLALDGWCFVVVLFCAALPEGV